MVSGQTLGHGIVPASSARNSSKRCHDQRTLIFSRTEVERKAKFSDRLSFWSVMEAREMPVLRGTMDAAG